MKDQGTPNQWNIEIFIDVIKESVPNMSWSQVIQELDYPGFIIKDPKALQFVLFSFIKATSNTPASFPIQFIYKPWKNSLGQVGSVKMISCRVKQVFTLRCIGFLLGGGGGGGGGGLNRLPNFQKRGP